MYSGPRDFFIFFIFTLLINVCTPVHFYFLLFVLTLMQPNLIVLSSAYFQIDLIHAGVGNERCHNTSPCSNSNIRVYLGLLLPRINFYLDFWKISFINNLGGHLIITFQIIYSRCLVNKSVIFNVQWKKWVYLLICNVGLRPINI